MPRRLPWGDRRYALRWRGTAPLSVIAEALEVTELELRLSLGVRYPRRPWTWRDDEVLRRLYPHHDTGEIARRLRRSPQAVKNRTNKLGLRKSAAWRARYAAWVWESRKRRRSSVEGIRNAVSLRESNQEQGGTA